MAIFISTIIPTIGRATLSRAVLSVLEQQFDKDKFEIIVVNDSGKSLPDLDWQNFSNKQIIQTNRRERCVARNVGAATAKGTYLHFLDDDDWLLPGAFHHFWKLTQLREAAIYYGGYRFVDNSDHILEECYPNESGNCFIRFMSGEWQPLQASLFKADVFHSIGGFTPLEMLHGGDEDVDLTRRISLQNNIAGICELVATIRIGREESTTNYVNLKEQSRQSRDIILNMPGAFSRLCESARERRNATRYWYGRIVWIYMSSVAWNIQQRKIFTALSRLVYLTTAIIIFFRFMLSSEFWRGATKPHFTKGWLVTE